MKQYTRRRLMAAGLGAATIGSLAGCTALGDEGQSTGVADGASGQASFFVFGDFLDAVAGGAATAETLVPVGQHGHGWEPGPDTQAKVLDSDLFVYVTEGFQPWADDLMRSLRDDGTDVEFVEAADGVDFIDGGHNHEDEEHDDHEDQNEHGDDEHGHHDDEESNHDGEGHDSEEHDGKDPHFWLDPQRATQAVDTIAAGLSAVDGDNAETYEANAAAYNERLADLDAAFESALETADKDVVLVAGHGAYGYLADRYDFEIETLTGFRPDERPTPRDIERAQEVIDDHDLDYVCVDPLESQTAAEQLVEETDATEVLPLTPIPGQTDEWADNGWGYIDIMTQINLETLITALGAE